MFKESQIILPEIADVIDAVSQHGDALGAEAEGETGVALGVVAAVAQDVGVHHAAAADLQPAAAADGAALAAAQKALHVEFRGGFGEWEEARPETRTHVLSEQASGQVGERGLQVAEGDAFTHRDAFDLVELRLVARVGLFIAVTHPRQHQPHRRRILGVRRGVFAHGADLARRGVRAHHDRVVAAFAGFHEIRVLHVAGWMPDGEVEQLEVVFVRLDLAAAEDLEAHLAEHAVKLAQHLRVGVQPARVQRPARQGHIHFLFGDGLRQRGFFERLRLFGQRSFERYLHAVGGLPHLRTQLRGELAQALEGRRDGGVLAKVRIAPG